MNSDFIIKYIRTKRKIRKIVTYNNDTLRKEHRFIKDKINSNFEPSIFSKGYIKNESIYTNASAHLYNNYFIKTDIKSFFNSINHNLLKKKLYYELNKVASPKDCDLIIKKCTVSKRGLPLGLITSPTLSNIYLKSFDMQLYNSLKLIDCVNIIYTRYADDMVISFKECSNLNATYNEIIKLIKKLLNEYHLIINEQKTQFIDFNTSKQVRITGVSIVEKDGIRRLSIGRNQKRKLFYQAINLKKSKKYDLNEAKKLKGKMSFYLSIEKTSFEDFISTNMMKEMEELGYNSFIEFMKNL